MINSFRLGTFLCLSLVTVATYAQDIRTKGALRGTIRDVNGAVIANAKVTVSGQQIVERVVTANGGGVFEVENLTPGIYHIKAEQHCFKTVAISSVEVFVGKATTLKLTLQAGSIAEVVDVLIADTRAVDQSSTAGGANLNDQLFKNLPVQRGVSGLFYLAAGVSDSLGGGLDNPSISGGSPLDNF